MSIANPKLEVLFDSLRILFKDKVRGVSQNQPAAHYCVGAGVLRLFSELHAGINCQSGFPGAGEMAREMVKFFPTADLNELETYCNRIITNNDQLKFENSWKVVEEMLLKFPNSLVARCMDLQLAEDTGMISPLSEKDKATLKEINLL